MSCPNRISCHPIDQIQFSDSGLPVLTADNFAEDIHDPGVELPSAVPADFRDGFLVAAAGPIHPFVGDGDIGIHDGQNSRFDGNLFLF